MASLELFSRCVTLLSVSCTDINDHADVVEAVECLAVDWNELAIKLHLNNDDIKVLRQNNLGDTRACLNGAMELWLKQKYNTASFGHPSWKTLVKAVEGMDEALAYKIANKHRGIYVRTHEP